MLTFTRKLKVLVIGGGSGGAGGAEAPPTFRLGVLSTPMQI